MMDVQGLGKTKDYDDVNFNSLYSFLCTANKQIQFLNDTFQI